MYEITEIRLLLEDKILICPKYIVYYKYRVIKNSIPNKTFLLVPHIEKICIENMWLVVASEYDDNFLVLSFVPPLVKSKFIKICAK